jgi:ABC-type microcin C transport system duplicated ATPase subunit YejF
MKLLEVEKLKISFFTELGKVCAVQDFSFEVGEGEITALVGESGSGKSVCAHCITGLMKRAGAVKEGGTVRFMGTEIDYNDEKALRSLRGKAIGYIFQEPMASLNPLQTIEKQITERLIHVEGASAAAARARAVELLSIVGVRSGEARLSDLPHLFSGGERQRVMIAAALASNPRLLIADEPTTALDVTVQKQILELIRDLRQQFNMSVLFITHDLGLVRRYADRVIVVKDGLVVETGTTDEVFQNPRQPYTIDLIRVPELKAGQPDESGQIILDVADLSVVYKTGRKSEFVAVDKASFSLRTASSLGIVGESGSGKTSLAKAILRLNVPSKGHVQFSGQDVPSLGPEPLRKLRQHMQIVFQDPYGSLNPRMTVEMIIAEGLLAQGWGRGEKLHEAVDAALSDVGLAGDIKDRYPHEFSGGQRQRIAIARALVLRPKLVIFDEPTSSLDRNVQFQVVKLLKNLQEKYRISYIFISHDLNLVRSICHEIIVMKDGRIVEAGRAEDIFNSPAEEYTKTLVSLSAI